MPTSYYKPTIDCKTVDSRFGGTTSGRERNPLLDMVAHSWACFRFNLVSSLIGLENPEVFDYQYRDWLNHHTLSNRD